MTVGEPTSGGVPAERRPFGQPPGSWQPHFHRRAVLTREQRQAIIAKYTEAITDNPDLSKSAFAKSEAPNYPVTAAAIRRVINRWA